MSRDAALGEGMGSLETILKNYSREQGKYDPNYDINTYKTQGLDLSALMRLLSGNQSRAVGDAGRLAGAQAAAGGMNPYAATQHAQSGIYNSYADKFADAPMQAFQSQLGANQSNFGNLYQLLALKMGLAGQREGSPLGGILGGLGQLGGAYLGRPQIKE